MNYDRAHIHADSQYPRDLWETSQADLAALDPLLAELAARYAVTLTQPSGKHPTPARELSSKGASAIRTVLFFRRYPEATDTGPGEPLYVLGIRVATQGECWEQPLYLLGLRNPYPNESWDEVGRYSSASVRLVDPELRTAIEASAARAFGTKTT